MRGMCPISFKKIDENVVRINAAQAVLFILLFLFSPLKLIILVVTADFFARGFKMPEYSLFAKVSRKILALAKVKPVMTDAAPKIFAARIGFLFSCMLTACWILNQSFAALLIGLMFAACALLEAAFRFCIACKMYPLVCKITPN